MTSTLILAIVAAIAAGSFAVFDEKDAMTDETLAGVLAEAPTGQMVIFCNKADGKNTRIFLKPRRPMDGMTSLLKTPVSLRFDDNPREISMWETGDAYAYSRSKKVVYGFVRKLVHAKRLRVRLETLRDQADFDFQLDNSREAINYVADKCDDTGLRTAVSAP